MSDAPIFESPEPVVPPVNWRQARRFLVFLAVVTVLVLGLGLVYASLLLPIGVGAFLAYLLLPLVDKLETLRVKRVLATAAIIIFALGIIALAVSRMAPLLYAQALYIVKLLPNAVAAVMEKWRPLVEQYVVDLGFMTPDEIHDFLSYSSLLGKLQSQLQAGISGVWRTGTSLAGGMVNIVLVPVVTFFLLNDYKALRGATLALVPQDLIVPMQFVTAKVNLTLRSVIKGQATVAGILAGLYVIGLTVVDLQSAIAIGVVAGVCRIVPYLDVIVGLTLSMIVLLSNFAGWGQVASVVLVFLIVQAIDGAFITPRVIGERVGLHPMVVILSVLAFSDWFGLWGVIVAIPLVAIVKVLLEAAAPFYRASRAYRVWSDVGR